jgi:hypothetical protein
MTKPLGSFSAADITAAAAATADEIIAAIGADSPATGHVAALQEALPGKESTA